MIRLHWILQFLRRFRLQMMIWRRELDLIYLTYSTRFLIHFWLDTTFSAQTYLTLQTWHVIWFDKFYQIQPLYAAKQLNTAFIYAYSWLSWDRWGWFMRGRDDVSLWGFLLHLPVLGGVSWCDLYNIWKWVTFDFSIYWKDFRLRVSLNQSIVYSSFI